VIAGIARGFRDDMGERATFRALTSRSLFARRDAFVVAFDRRKRAIVAAPIAIFTFAFHRICLPLENARTAVCDPRVHTMSCVGVDSQPYNSPEKSKIVLAIISQKKMYLIPD
jgi:hypothetical protein